MCWPYNGNKNIVTIEVVIDSIVNPFKVYDIFWTRGYIPVFLVRGCFEAFGKIFVFCLVFLYFLLFFHNNEK